jgi:broad specificity phosphatase PhoE
MKIIIIRHGETEDNRRGIIRGRSEQGLTKTGKEQAQKASLLLKDEKIDIIYSSDLQRCVETTNNIKLYHSKSPILFTPFLREIGGGSISNLPSWLPPALIFKALGLALKFNFHAPGGESYKALRKRMKTFINEIYYSHPDDTVLLVTHGITIQAIRAVLKMPGYKKSLGSVLPNCGIIRSTIRTEIAN